MKKLSAIDSPLLAVTEDTGSAMQLPTIREILRLIANVKAESADEARRTQRIVMRLRDKTQADLVLENDDFAFIMKTLERNQMNLTAWMQGQILETLDGADKVETK